MRQLLASTLLVLLVLVRAQATDICDECEVAAGDIPAKFLDVKVKELPLGIEIWDIPEMVKALENVDGTILFVDNRPVKAFETATVKPAVSLVVTQKGVPVPAADEPNEMTRERLVQAMKDLNNDTAKVRVVFICLGPKCHRAYNAALRCVIDYKMDPSQIIWFRAGFPSLLKHIQDTPRLSKKIGDLLKGEEFAK